MDLQRCHVSGCGQVRHPEEDRDRDSPVHNYGAGEGQGEAEILVP